MISLRFGDHFVSSLSYPIGAAKKQEARLGDPGGSPQAGLGKDKEEGMNKLRRKSLQRINDQLAILKEELAEILEGEEEARDNIPESLQETPQYEKADAACDAIEAAVDALDEAMSQIEEAIE